MKSIIKIDKNIFSFIYLEKCAIFLRQWSKRCYENYSPPSYNTILNLRSIMQGFQMIPILNITLFQTKIFFFIFYIQIPNKPTSEFISIQTFQKAIVKNVVIKYWHSKNGTLLVKVSNYSIQCDLKFLLIIAISFEIGIIQNFREFKIFLGPDNNFRITFIYKLIYIAKFSMFLFKSQVYF